MSNSLAIAAVTATLRSMLDSASGGLTANLPADIPSSLGLDSVTVTTKTHEKARPSAKTSPLPPAPSPPAAGGVDAPLLAQCVWPQR
jgi:hypothetical protein